MATIQTVLQQAKQQLAIFQPSAQLEAELLLGLCLQQSRSYLMTWPEQQLDSIQLATFNQLIQRRLSGEPIAYITGQREFWSLDLAVSPATLIPRPETELLVEQALHLIPAQQTMRLADLGTGSGCIAVAIASERPRCSITAIDNSEAALAIARHNAARHDLHNVAFVCNDWLAGLDAPPFDLIVSNPPYVAAQDPHLQQGDLPFEPCSALIAGHDGLAAFRDIASQARNYLKPGGWLLLEHGYDQAEAVMTLLQQTGYADVQGYSDLAANPRLMLARQP